MGGLGAAAPGTPAGGLLFGQQAGQSGHSSYLYKNQQHIEMRAPDNPISALRAPRYKLFILLHLLRCTPHAHHLHDD